MKVLVTGGAGFIGSHVVDLLVGRGDDVTVLDNLDPQVHGSSAVSPAHILGHVNSGAVRFVLGDITDAQAVAASLSGAEAVVHLAAAVGVGQSMYRPHYYVKTNSMGTGQLLEHLILEKPGIQKLVLASSMSVYGEGSYRCERCGRIDRARRDAARLSRHQWEPLCSRCGDPLTPEPTEEAKPPDIRSVYAATKKNQEDLFLSFGEAYEIPTFALRFFNVFGCRQALGNPYTGVAAIFLSRLLNGQRPVVFEDGLQSRDLVDVRDIARAVTLALDSEQTGAHAMNIGSGQPLTVVSLARILARKLGCDIEPEALGQFRSGDIRHCFADTGLASRCLGFTAHYRFEDAVDDLIVWCRAEQASDRTANSLSELRRHGLVR